MRCGRSGSRRKESHNVGVKAVKQQIEDVKHQIEEAERKYDLEKAGAAAIRQHCRSLRSRLEAAKGTRPIPRHEEARLLKEEVGRRGDSRGRFRLDGNPGQLSWSRAEKEKLPTARQRYSTRESVGQEGGSRRCSGSGAARASRV